MTDSFVNYNFLIFMYTFNSTRNVKTLVCTPLSLLFASTSTTPFGNSIDYNQSRVVFNKRTYGLFKNLPLTDRKLKQKLIHISNNIKSETPFQKKQFKQKLKIIFYKKLNRFFFRDGRKILMNNFNIKKTLIQKFVTKKIANFIKNMHGPRNTIYFCNDVLVKCGLFYSLKDANSFIGQFGINLQGVWNYNPNKIMTEASLFAVITDSSLVTRCTKKKLQIIHNLKKLKFYKYRVKLFSTRKQFSWVSTKSWFQEYTFLTTDRLSNIEFDFKTMSGVVLCIGENAGRSNLNYDLSWFMGRSYTWKYLT